MRDGGMNPRLLLVEDDPISQIYLAEAARALPAEVDCAGSLSQAMQLADRHRYDAWLIDAHLPDGSGTELLSRLHRAQPSPHPPALAHTASRQPEDLAALRVAGFDAVASKPLAPEAWQSVIRACLGDAEPPPAWDDDSALRALSGNAEAVASLRSLFLAELPKQHRTILAAITRGDGDAARDELHRLKASCAFVGAARMQRAADALHAAPLDGETRRQFDEAVADVIAAAPASA